MSFVMRPKKPPSGLMKGGDRALTGKDSFKSKKSHMLAAEPNEAQFGPHTHTLVQNADSKTLFAHTSIYKHGIMMHVRLSL